MVFASVLAASLRPNTELLLLELQSKCVLVGITGQHDGYKMLKAMRLKAALPSAIHDISSLFHEKAWEAMRDEALPNGCSSQQFADKVNTLLKDHVPHLASVDLSGVKLSKAIVNFMPSACATERKSTHPVLLRPGADKVTGFAS